MNDLFYCSTVDNEELQDLLCPNSDKKLKLFEDVKKGVMCLNLEEVAVTNAKDILEMLQKGEALVDGFWYFGRLL